MTSIQFFVPGQVTAQGSKRAVTRGQKTVLLDMNKQLGPWRTTIATHAARAIRALPLNDHGKYPLTGPVAVVLQADYARPKSHYGTGRNAAVLKSGMPQWKTSAPDSDKAARAALDALTGVLYKDDAQVCELSIVKCYTEDEPGLHVEVEAL